MGSLGHLYPLSPSPASPHLHNNDAFNHSPIAPRQLASQGLPLDNAGPQARQRFVPFLYPCAMTLHLIWTGTRAAQQASTLLQLSSQLNI